MNSQKKLQILSSVMASCCVLLMIAIPASVIWFWIYLGENAASLSIARYNVLLDMQYIGLSQQIFACIVSMLPALMMVYGIWNLRQLFLLFKQGVFFSVEATRHLYKFGLMLLVTALLKPVVSVALSAILTSGNPAGKKSIVVEFGSNEIGLIFIATTFFIITWILQEGRKLANENAEFI